METDLMLAVIKDARTCKPDDTDADEWIEKSIRRAEHAMWKIEELDKDELQARRRFNESIKEIGRCRESVREKCHHIWEHFTGDSSIGCDSYDECRLCGKTK